MPKQSRSSRRTFWQEVLTRQEASGLSIQQFCRRERLGVSTVYAWKRRFRQLSRRPKKAEWPAAGFARVRIVPEPAKSLADGTIEILLPADRRVRVAGRVDKTMLADVLAVLTSAGPDGREGESSC
jgi:hypothetical protein